MAGPDLSNYVEVKDRLAMALAKWPQLRVIESIPEIVTIDDRHFVQVTCTVYREPDDTLPCTATAWEPFPGVTPFTRNSEMMNAGTSALGRALGYMGIGIERSVASAVEVANRMAERVSRDSRPPLEKTPSQNGSGSTKPPSEAQLGLLRRIAAERGVEIEIPETSTQCAQMIDEIKAMPRIQ
jgi:hypothetical protein